MMSVSKDEQERAIFRSRRIALADRESDRVTVERIKAKSIARNMIVNGEPVDKIMLYTDLTRAEVESLRDAD